MSKMKSQTARQQCDRLLNDLVRALGPEAERQGLTEEQLVAELKEVRRAIYRETYGKTPTK